MRKAILLVLVLLYTYVGHAQQYNCVQQSEKHYFTNSNGYLRCIAIDSMKVVGADTMYYPFKTWRMDYYLLDTTKGSWIGSKVIKQGDGTFLFNTAWMDTIIIKTQAVIGDSWVLYNDTSSRWYSATMVSEDTMTFLGITDSVKRIKITSYKGSTINLADSINNFELLLSKNNGFVCAFDFYLFPYHKPWDSVLDVSIDPRLFEIAGSGAIRKSSFLFSLVDYHVPREKDIFDFNVGDVFMTSGGNENFCGTDYYDVDYDSILSKTVTSPYQVDYLILRNGKTTTVPDGPDPVTHAYGSYSYPLSYDTSVLTEFVNIPEGINSFGEAWYYLPADSSHCRPGALFKHKNIRPFEGCDYLAVYKTGFQKVKWNDYYWGTCPIGFAIGCDGTRNSGLFFSVKDGVSCGYRANVSAVDEVSLTSHCNVFPNPTTGVLNISASFKVASVFVCNVLGQVVYSDYFNAKEVSFDVSHLPAGVYIARINETVMTRFVRE